MNFDRQQSQGCAGLKIQTFFFFYYSKGATPWSHGGCDPIRMYIVLMLFFVSLLLLLLLLLPLFGWLLMFSNVEKLYCSSVPFHFCFFNRKFIFSLCMGFEIHEVCHTYSELLGIDTVHVKVFIVLCNIKQFVILRRGTFYKSKHKKQHTIYWCNLSVCWHQNTSQHLQKKRKRKRKNIGYKYFFFECNAGTSSAWKRAKGFQSRRVMMSGLGRSSTSWFQIKSPSIAQQLRNKNKKKNKKRK